LTTVRITLPDALAQEAERAGLLAPESVESMLREKLKEKRVDELFAAMDRMSAVEDPATMSPEEMADEIREMMAERRARSRE
jgi:hypothetical protein